MIERGPFLKLIPRIPCPICTSGDGDVPVMLEGEVAYVCDRCWSQVDDDRERDTVLDLDDLNVEGQPEFNGSFR